MTISLSELEQVINYWRALRPSSGEERTLSHEVNVLATDYALMIFHGMNAIAAEKLAPESLQLLQAWREQVRN